MSIAKLSIIFAMVFSMSLMAERPLPAKVRPKPPSGEKERVESRVHEGAGEIRATVKDEGPEPYYCAVIEYASKRTTKVKYLVRDVRVDVASSEAVAEIPDPSDDEFDPYNCDQQLGTKIPVKTMGQDGEETIEY